MKQYKIDNTPVLVQWDRDTGCYAAWTDADEPLFATGATEQQAVNALKAKMYGTELSEEAEQAYRDFLAGRPIGQDAEHAPHRNGQHSAFFEAFGRRTKPAKVWRPRKES